MKIFDFASRFRKIFEYPLRMPVLRNGNTQRGFKWKRWIIRRAFDKLVSNCHGAHVTKWRPEHHAKEIQDGIFDKTDWHHRTCRTEGPRRAVPSRCCQNISMIKGEADNITH